MIDEDESSILRKLEATTIHGCCGCSCNVCADGHKGGLHTVDCNARFWKEVEADGTDRA